MFDKLKKEQITPPIDESYANEAAMIADQANQEQGFIYYDGSSYWEYLGTTVGDISDYRQLGGGGGGGGGTRVAFSSVIDPTGNFFSQHSQTGAIAYTLGAGLVINDHFENTTRHYIEANGTGGKPTFSSAFVLQMDTWSNNTGDINCLIFKVGISGKIYVWMDNVELA